MNENDTKDISKNFSYFVKNELDRAKNDYNHNGFYFAVQPIISTKNVFKDYISNKLQERRERKKTNADNKSEPENLEKRTIIETNFGAKNEEEIINDFYIDKLVFATTSSILTEHPEYNTSEKISGLKNRVLSFITSVQTAMDAKQLYDIKKVDISEFRESVKILGSKALNYKSDVSNLKVA